MRLEELCNLQNILSESDFNSRRFLLRFIKTHGTNSNMNIIINYDIKQKYTFIQANKCIFKSSR